jgi:hypothetical protein
MRVSTVRPVVILLAFSLLLSVASLSTMAQGTPEAATPAPPTARGDLPEEFCTEDEIGLGIGGIIERPEGGALVKPFATSGRDLYLLELTLPKDTCLGYGSHYLHDGAITWMVQSGEIEFATQPIAGLPEATVTAYDATGEAITVSATPTALGPGDWVTLDRAAEYSYRHVGDEPAVVIMAVNEIDPYGGVDRGCRGGCPGRKG